MTFAAFFYFIFDTKGTSFGAYKLISFLIPSIHVPTDAKEINLYAQACRRQKIADQ